MFGGQPEFKITIILLDQSSVQKKISKNLLTTRLLTIGTMSNNTDTRDL